MTRLGLAQMAQVVICHFFSIKSLSQQMLITGGEDSSNDVQDNFLKIQMFLMYVQQHSLKLTCNKAIISTQCQYKPLQYVAIQPGYHYKNYSNF